MLSGRRDLALTKQKTLDKTLKEQPEVKFICPTDIRYRGMAKEKNNSFKLEPE